MQFRSAPNAGAKKMNLSWENFKVIKCLADPHSIFWTPFELSTAFGGDCQYYSRHCSWLADHGLAEKMPFKATFIYKLTDEGRRWALVPL